VKITGQFLLTILHGTSDKSRNSIADNPVLVARLLDSRPIDGHGRPRTHQREESECPAAHAMMRLRRASVIATLTLLAWTATASAEMRMGFVVSSD
jgi:hypothetical protein